MEGDLALQVVSKDALRLFFVSSNKRIHEIKGGEGFRAPEPHQS